MSNPLALTLEQPLEIDDARRAARRLADVRRAAEDELQRMTEEAAEKERDYRKAFSQAFVNSGEGTAAQREAAARAAVADKAYERDLAAGMVRVQIERLRGLEGERSQLKSLTEWSMRLQIDGREQTGQTFGSRRAA